MNGSEMNTVAIYARMTEIFRDVFDDDSLTLKPGLTAADVKGWDSFRQVEILIAIQEAFKMKFTSREIDGLGCVGDIVKAVHNHQKP